MILPEFQMQILTYSVFGLFVLPGVPPSSLPLWL